MGRRNPVCPGYAWLSSGRPDGFIHVQGHLQEVDAGNFIPPPRWLLLDFVFVLLYLMKLAEARLVPLILLLLWWWVNQLAVLGLPAVDAAVAGEVFAGPALSWCLGLPIVSMILGLANLVLYFRWMGPQRLMFLVLWKLARELSRWLY